MGFMKRNTALIIFAVTMAVAIAVVIFTSLMTQTNNTALFYTENYSADGGWYLVLENGEKNPLDIVSREKAGAENSVLTISRTLDEHIGSDYVLCIQTKNEFVRAYVAGKLIYDYNYSTSGFGSEIGAIWNMINIPVESGGSELTVEIIPMSGSHGTAPYPIYLGSHAAIVSDLIMQKHLIIIECFVIFLFSVVLFCIFIYKFFKKDQHAKSFLFLGMFALLATVWNITDSLVLQFILPNKAVSFMLFNCSFLLMPIPFALYMGTIFKKKRVFFDIIATVTGVYFFLRLFLYAKDCANFEYALFIIHLIMFIIIVSTLSLCVKNRRDKEHRYIFFAISALGIISGISLIVFYAKDLLRVNRANYSLYFCHATLIFFIIILLGMIVRSYKLQKLADKAIFYEQCAYTDPLTGTLNRFSFEKKLEHIDAKMKTLSSVCMVVFDLNNLKKTNDKYGHSVGDELIKNTFDCISNAFNHIGYVYRTGGDEAVVIISDISKDAVAACLYDFQKVVNEYNDERLVAIDVAVGIAYFDNVANKNMRATDFLRVADAEMYMNKKAKKGIKR